LGKFFEWIGFSGCLRLHSEMVVDRHMRSCLNPSNRIFLSLMRKNNFLSMHSHGNRGQSPIYIKFNPKLILTSNFPVFNYLSADLSKGCLCFYQGRCLLCMGPGERTHVNFSLGAKAIALWRGFLEHMTYFRLSRYTK